ncbi:hypothetical protein ACMAY7_15970 [Rhodobacteraceae bacterium nBUS_24]
MQGDDDDFSVTGEGTEILNLPLYTERKADGIYRYRRRVPKALRCRVGKGYLSLQRLFRIENWYREEVMALSE